MNCLSFPKKLAKNCLPPAPAEISTIRKILLFFCLTVIILIDSVQP